MIEEIDRRLKDWVGTVVQGVDVSFGTPRDSGDQPAVGLYLIELNHYPLASNGRRPPLQISLRYLVTTWAERPEDAHRILGKLVFAAMEHRDFEVQLEPLSAALWSAFGVVPRPSFRLQLPVRLERPEPQVPQVQAPPLVRGSATRILDGVVLGPGDIPLSDVRVDLPILQLATRTDSKGRFRFAAVPAEPPVTQLRVQLKGRELAVTTEQASADQGPVVIHFDAMEV